MAVSSNSTALPFLAAAQVLPDDPRYPQRFSFLRQKPVSSPAQRADQPVATHEDKIMNQHVNRRTLISTSAAITAAAMTSEAVAEALADRQWEEVEANVAQAADADLPVDLRSHDLHAASIGQLMLLIKGHREAFLAFESVCHLNDTVALGREPTRREMRLFLKADRAEETAFMALCEHRCMTTYEYQTKARYLHVHHQGGGLQQYHMEALLKSSLPLATYKMRKPSAKSIAWVNKMHADGYVFVCRGHVRDLDSYAIRGDLTEGDDTKQFLIVLKRMARRAV